MIFNSNVNITNNSTGSEQATPVISVDANGLITATAGDKVATHQLTVKDTTDYTPGLSNQTIAAGQYLIGAQVISGDKDLKAENIKSGVNIFGITGSYQGSSDLWRICFFSTDSTYPSDDIFGDIENELADNGSLNIYFNETNISECRVLSVTGMCGGYPYFCATELHPLFEDYDEDFPLHGFSYNEDDGVWYHNLPIEVNNRINFYGRLSIFITGFDYPSYVDDVYGYIAVKMS